MNIDRNTVLSLLAIAGAVVGGGGNYLHTDSVSAEDRAARRLEWSIRACEIDLLVAKDGRPDMVEYCTLEALKKLKEARNGGK